ncbi:lipoyl synthase [candidate division BRC1 bacterium HGW-BRC1-1]|jgi:lipoic acid synthetase|nr:MAG: lipoyl synthase [candidate division BRC1 bacterium HGW-BRC1-1]
MSTIPSEDINEDGSSSGTTAPRKHPAWVRARMPGRAHFSETNEVLRRHGLHTVCEEAECPNIGECYGHHTATFMILGNVCTRGCTFCAVTQNNPRAMPPDATEPERLAQAAAELGLSHIVITSVTRDDLPDQGSKHFALCAEAIKRLRPEARVEVLIPDFRGRADLLATVVRSPIDILNHNTETVPRLYRKVRRGARYWRTMVLLERCKELRPGLRTKSGLMLGLGETDDEIRAVLNDLREAECDIVTLGQYLQPSGDQLAVERYLEPSEFKMWQDYAEALGFLHVESGPLVRSSYHAWKHTADLEIHGE